MMTVQDLINALEEQPKGLEVTALIWPQSTGGDIRHLSVMNAARLFDGKDAKVVLRIAESL